MATPNAAYPTMDPRQIIVKRLDRQRQENITDVDDLKDSIARLRAKAPHTGGFIHPVVTRQEDGQTILVVGERRLTAALELNLPNIPYRDFAELTHQEAEEIELEENSKRRDITWRDQVRSISRLHNIYKSQTTGWNVDQTAERLGMSRAYVYKILYVNDGLPTGRVDRAESIEQAFNTLQRFAERKAEEIVGNIIAKGAELFANGASASVSADTDFIMVSSIAIAPEPNVGASAMDLLNDVPALAPAPMPIIIAAPKPQEPVLCANFAEWIRTYTGPKFTLIHCDFPYGNYRGGDSQGAMGALETEDFYDNDEGVYWNLLTTLTEGLDKIMSYSAHMLFWFSMNFYTETVKRLRSTGLTVHDHPIVWHKTGGPGGLGVVPGTAVTYPRRTYDTALLAVRGQRPLAKPGMNSYAAPTAGNKIHPSQKPEPMLRFFLQMLVDETTTMLDPTCGSGAALRVAEDLGAKSVLGLELDPNYAQSANTKTLQARVLRQAGQTLRED